MSDALPMLASSEPHQAVASNLSRTASDQEKSPENQPFNDMLQTYLQLPTEATPELELPVTSLVAALPVEGHDGNDLPSDQPTIAWSALFSWSGTPLGTATAGMNPVQQAAADKTGGEPRTPVALTQTLPHLLQSNTRGAPVMANSTDTTAAVDPNDMFLSQLLDTQAARVSQSATEQANPLLKAASLPVTALDQSANVTQALGAAGSLLQTVNSAKTDLHPGPITVSPQHPAWNNALGERIQWMVGQNLQQAEIRLEPPELGTLEVKISVHRDQASLTFLTANSQVRDAVESAAMRLREMFSDIGLQLGDVNVSQESFAQHQRDEGGAASNQAIATDADETTIGQEVQVSETRIRGANSLLDTYA